VVDAAAREAAPPHTAWKASPLAFPFKTVWTGAVGSGLKYLAGGLSVT